MPRLITLFTIIVLCASHNLVAAKAPTPAKLTPLSTEQPHLATLSGATPAENQVFIQGPLPSFVKVWRADDPKQSPVEFGFNTDATEITLFLPKQAEQATPQDFRFLLTEKTAVHSDGTVVLSALDSKVVGTGAKLETHPGSHRIGFWNKPADYVTWDFQAPLGAYSVDLVYSRASRDGTKVSINIAGTKYPLTLKTTGSWYRYRVTPVCKVMLDGKTHKAEVRVEKIINGGVMNLKAIILTPTN